MSTPFGFTYQLREWSVVWEQNSLVDCEGHYQMEEENSNDGDFVGRNISSFKQRKKNTCAS